MTLLDHWAPSNWRSLDSGDVDLGSSAPVLLPDGLVFEIGEQGVGYLLSASHLGGTGASPSYQGRAPSGNWGGAIYTNGIIYVTCSSGLRAPGAERQRGGTAVGTWQVSSAINGATDPRRRPGLGRGLEHRNAVRARPAKPARRS